MPGTGKVGRPRGLAQRVRELTGDFSRQINTMIAIASDELYRNDKHVTVKVSERIEAIKWLADRAHGKAVETSLQVNGEIEALGDQLDIARDQIAELARHLRTVKPQVDASAEGSADQAAVPTAKVA